MGTHASTITNKRDEADQQLTKYYLNNKEKIGYSTNAVGVDLVNKDVTMTAGKHGPVVLRDYNFVGQLQQFNRERIPERVVHAKGAGAFGYFECTRELSDMTIASVFEHVGKRTPIVVRFSTTSGETGSADTVRDNRGFAIKFYTETGNWDLVGSSSPVFFIRDPILFPMLVHVEKKNPVTNLKNWDMFWDFMTLRPETVHQILFLFSDRGIPYSFRHMHGFGNHAFSFNGPNGKLLWVKFIYKTDQGIKNMDSSEVAEIAGTDPDHATRDLYNSIEEGKETGKFPSWTFYIQTMTPEQAQQLDFNPFDITKVWPRAQFPFQKVGKIVLNQNPSNYFVDVEQAAFAVKNLIPGIGISPDRMLDGRLFAYRDTQLHRLGSNFQQLPVNRPLVKVANFERNGQDALYNQYGAPNYHPNSFGGPEVNPLAKYGISPPENVSGEIDFHDLEDENNFSQANKFWNKVLDEAAKERLVNNLVTSIQKSTPEITDRAVKMFKQVDPNLGERINQQLVKPQVYL